MARPNRDRNKAGYLRHYNMVRYSPDGHLRKDVGDQWRTPPWLVAGIRAYVEAPLVLDLFSDGENSIAPNYFTVEDNALEQDWAATMDKVAGGLSQVAMAFGNPPYSRFGTASAPVTGMPLIMAKAIQEHRKAVGLRQVFLVKSATSEAWWPDADATQIIHIKGRIAFDPPHWFTPANEREAADSGAGFGASLVYFNGYPNRGQHRERYVAREDLAKAGEPFLDEINATIAANRRKFGDFSEDL